MRDEAAIEAEIKAKGLTAPRITPDHVDATIMQEEYAVFFGVLTVCVLRLRNGFTVVGESACASPENFDEALGRRIARENARAKIWPLEGYALRERLAGDRAKDLALRTAAERFQAYEEQHRAKGTAESLEKAEANRVAAEACLAAVECWA